MLAVAQLLAEETTVRVRLVGPLLIRLLPDKLKLTEDWFADTLTTVLAPPAVIVREDVDAPVRLIVPEIVYWFVAVLQVGVTGPTTKAQG